MIRKEMRAPNGEMKPLTEHDLAYWEGPYRYEPFPKVLFRCRPASSTAKWREEETDMAITATTLATDMKASDLTINVARTRSGTC